MAKHYISAAVVFGAALVLAACSDEPKTAATDTKTDTDKKEAAPTEPVLAKTAFWEMYRPARDWSRDVAPLTLTSGELKGYKVEAGKAPVWIAVFASPSLKQARTYTYAIASDLPTIHKGVTAKPAEPWTPSPKSQPFATAEFQINSDAAYEAAAKDGESFLKKHSDLPVSMFLSSTSRFSTPVWYVLWGNQKLGYAAYVNATTGMVEKTKK